MGAATLVLSEVQGLRWEDNDERRLLKNAEVFVINMQRRRKITQLPQLVCRITWLTLEPRAFRIQIHSVTPGSSRRSAERGAVTSRPYLYVIGYLSH